MMMYTLPTSELPKLATAPRGDVTRLLAQLHAGDRDAEARLFDLVYQELHRIAERQSGRERPGHTLAATAIVNEAYLRLFHGEVPEWQDRAHFYCTAARVMRRIMVDYARRRATQKQGGGAVREELTEMLGADGRDLDTVLAVDEALDRLANQHRTEAQVVELWFRAGLKLEEIGRTLQISERTVQRHLKFALAWLKVELGQ